MLPLPEVLNDTAKKPAIVEDCLKLIDAEVADKSGFSGLTIKAGYGAVKGIKPGFVKKVVEDLLPEFATALSPIYDEAREANKPVTIHFIANAGRVADALLTITDEKAKRSKSGVVRGTYDKLRGTARKNVEAAVPRLGAMIEKHANA